MRINVINKDANNFKLQITDLDLPNKIMVNYINRSKALLDNNYGKVLYFLSLKLLLIKKILL